VRITCGRCSSTVVTSRRSAFCWLLFAVCTLLVDGCWLLPAACCLLLAYCLLPTAC
jgi:hypothetical protein